MSSARIVEGPFQVTDLPESSLVVLIGTSGSGKSTLARRVFRRTQVVSSDRIRGWIADDEGDQSVSVQAFKILHQLVLMRLAHGRLTIVDATNVSHSSRSGLLQLAKKAGRSAVAVLFDIDLDECVARDARRRRRRVGRDIIESQRRLHDATRAGLVDEGFDEIRIVNARDVEAMLSGGHNNLSPER